MEQKQQMQVNIDPSVKPWFADEVMIASTIKQEKNQYGEVRKEGLISLIFIDALGTRAIARIAMSKITAKALGNLLATEVKKLEDELSSKEELSSMTSATDGTTKSTATYIG